MIGAVGARDEAVADVVEGMIGHVGAQHLALEVELH